jgi:hypothetical protein
VSVFLRWGVFAILGVAALLYAYNASKRLAEARPAPGESVARPMNAPADSADNASDGAASAASAAPQALPSVSVPPQCEAELVVAQRALDMRRQGEPLDRLLRIQEIAWQEPGARRERLEKVASNWFNYQGEIQPANLRAEVISDCVQHSPAP